MLEEGLSFRAAVDMYSVQILLRLDGKRTLREILEEARLELQPDLAADGVRARVAARGAPDDRARIRRFRPVETGRRWC